MGSIHILWQMILADFRERTRRYSYLITLMVSIFVGYLVLSGKYSFTFGTYVADYSSHWVGTTMAVTGAVMFTIIGFYIVRSSISRDRETRVGEILATTSLSNSTYLIGKFISNLMVLWSMVLALTFFAIVGMLLMIPFGEISFIAFFTPFLFLPMTLMIPVAGLAVLFDTARWLRGILGNILYFFIAEFMIISGILEIPYIDGSGMGLFISSINETIHTFYPGVEIPMKIGFVRMFIDVDQVILTNPFVWNGIDWTLQLILSRLIWPAVGIILVYLSIALFDRFEHAKLKKKKKKSKTITMPSFENELSQQAMAKTISYKSIPSVLYTSSIIHSIKAEIKLGLKQVKPIWLYIGIALVVSEIFVPFDISRKFILPAAMIWPLLLWSSVGTREEQFNMHSLMYSSAGVHSRQFAAQLLSGIIIALIAVSPMLIRATIYGEHSYLLLLIVSALMIPSVAFAFGVVSKSKKLFEVMYLMIWYGGSIDKIKTIDLLGTVDESTGIMRIMFFAMLAISSVSLAYVRRRKKSYT